MEKLHYYNSENMACQAFGLAKDVVYDALVVAPSFSPYKLKLDTYCKVTTLKEGAYIAGYLVEKDDLKIAWVKIGSSDANVIDHIAICAELTFQKMIFIGAVGALTESFELGDICTPSYSIASGYANTYLKDSIKDFVPFEKVIPDMSFIDQIIGGSGQGGIKYRLSDRFHLSGYTALKHRQAPPSGDYLISPTRMPSVASRKYGAFPR